MARKQNLAHKNRPNSLRRGGRVSSILGRQSLIEQLESRRLLTGYFNEFDHVIHIPVVPLVNIDVTAKAHIEAFAQVGYDTRGLREAIAPLYSGNNFDGGKLLDGLWIDHSTHLYVDGSVDVGPALELPDFAKLSVQGGLAANLHVDLAGPNRPIRPFAGDLTDRLFNVSGKLSAFVSATVKAGVDTPLEFVGFDKTWTFAEATSVSVRQRPHCRAQQTDPATRHSADVVQLRPGDLHADLERRSKCPAAQYGRRAAAER